MKNSLKQEMMWVRGCFRGYEVEEDGVEVIAKVIIKKDEEIEDLRLILRRMEIKKEKI